MAKDPNKHVIALRRARAWAAGGVLAGTIAGGADAIVLFVFAVLSKEYPLLAHMSPELRPNLHRPTDVFFESLGFLFLGFMYGGCAGLMSQCLPSRTRQPAVLAAVWGSALGSLALVLASLVSVGQRQPLPMDFIFPAIFMLIPGVVFGLVLGISAPIAERILARFTRQPQSPEPPSEVGSG